MKPRTASNSTTDPTISKIVMPVSGLIAVPTDARDGPGAGCEATIDSARAFLYAASVMLLCVGSLVLHDFRNRLLNRRGIKSATGGQWSSKTVGRLQDGLGLGS